MAYRCVRKLAPCFGPNHTPSFAKEKSETSARLDRLFLSNKKEMMDTRYTVGRKARWREQLSTIFFEVGHSLVHI